MTRPQEPSATPSYPIKVFYEDTDAGGVVYHANYLKYLERGRSLWLESLGFTHTRLARELDIGFVVAHADVHFKAPARLDDNLQVTVEVSAMRRASLRFRQGVWRDARLLVQAQFKVACVRLSSLSPCALPERLRSHGQSSNGA